MTEPSNSLLLCGELTALPILSHCCRDVRFSRFSLTVRRESQNADVIPVIAPDHLLPPTLDVGDMLEVRGQLRAYSMQHREEWAPEGGDGYAGKNRLIIVGFARSILPGMERHENVVDLVGWICRPPVYRMTPLGREITDVFVSVGRAFGKSDYLPVIAWGGNARRTADYRVGDYVRICGRVQSRVYYKRLPDGASVEKTAYEVSASSIQLV